MITANSEDRAVVFDLGKVLLDFDYGICVEKALPFTHLSSEELRKTIGQSPLLYQLETGLLTPEQFHAQLQEHCFLRTAFADFEKIFSDIFQPIPAMIELAQAIKKRGIPAFIFSNTNALAVRHIRAQYPFFSCFDGYIFSFEHRAMKPDARLYAVVEKVSGRAGSRLVYIDDRPENIDAGAARNWQTVLHRSPEQTRRELRQLKIVD